jgi:hypothetical protein
MEDTKTRYMAYWPEIHYEYTVGPVRYSGDRVRFTHNATLEEAESKQIVALYPVGKAVPVYYNPNNPEAAVLKKGIYWPVLVILAFAIVFGPLFWMQFQVNRKKFASLNTGG